MHSAYVEPLRSVLTNTFNISLEKNSQWQLSFSAYDDGSVAFNMLSVEASVWWNNQEYLIKQFQPDYSNGFTTVQVTAIHVAYEVSRIRQRETKAGTLTYTVNDVLSFYLKNNTLGFTWQVMGNFDKQQITDLGNGSGKDMLDKIISTWPDAVFYPDNKNIRIYQHASIAKNLGNRIDYLHDTPELKLSYDSTNIVNQVMAYGKQKDNASSDKAEYYFPPFMVTDETSVSQWGLHPGEDVSDERFTDANTMKEYALSQLTPQPTLSIEATEITNEKPILCEIRRLENRKDGFITEVEVVAYTHYPLDKSQATSITLNNRVKTILNYKSAQDKALNKAISAQLNRMSVAYKQVQEQFSQLVNSANETDARVYPWKDKAITAIGDSITYGWLRLDESGRDVTAPWTLQLKPIGKFSSVTNDGIGSTCITTQAGEYRPSFAERVDQIQGQDVVFMLGGINDFDQNVPLGTFLDSQTTTFYGALDYVAKSMLNNNQFARIVWATPMIEMGLHQHTFDEHGELIINGAGVTQLDYVNAIKRVAAYYSFTLLDLFSDCVVNPLSKPEMFRDLTHPNEQGYVLLGQQIAKFLNKL